MTETTEAPEAPPDVQLTFKVKTSGDTTHTVTMADSATVLDLKKTLATEAYENVPVERQRLIYSGKVLKNDEPLSTYKIKPNNTVHMVKSAASNPTPSSSTAAPQPAIPTNMSAGTANNPLAGLTGARFAGHANLPSADLFGADGGMGAPPDEEHLAQLLSDPNVRQTVNAALDNPEFINSMIQNHPTLRNMPNARDLIQTPFMRNLVTNPDMIRMVTRMTRAMNTGAGPEAFPAPGATDTTPPGAAASSGAAAAPGAGNAAQQNPFAGLPWWASMDASQMYPQMLAAGLGGANANTGTAGAAGAAGAGAGTQGQLPPNPFLALFNPAANPAATQAGTGAPGGAAQPRSADQGAAAAANPFAAFGPFNPQAMQPFFDAMMAGSGSNPQAAAAPADTRPPEERYAEQLRQLNDMGFYDFDRNVAALRRSGGSVQGAIEHLLSG